MIGVVVLVFDDDANAAAAFRIEKANHKNPGTVCMYVCMYAVVVVVAAAAAAAAVIIVIDGRFVVLLWRSGVRVRCGCCGFCRYSI